MDSGGAAVAQQRVPTFGLRHLRFLVDAQLWPRGRTDEYNFATARADLVDRCFRPRLPLRDQLRSEREFLLEALPRPARMRLQRAGVLDPVPHPRLTALADFLDLPDVIQRAFDAGTEIGIQPV